MTRPVPARVARRALLAKGFKEAQGSRDHEMFLLYERDAKTRFFVKLSRSGADVRLDHMRIMGRAFGIRTEDLYRVLNCEYDAAQTLEVWRTRPVR